MHCAPPYIQTTRFIGRLKERDDLDTWARSSFTMLVVEAIGGVGKSALTWEWTRDRAMKMIPELAGIVWWSFYEGGASTASFVREALAYATKVDPEDLGAMPQNEQVQAAPPVNCGGDLTYWCWMDSSGCSQLIINWTPQNF